MRRDGQLTMGEIAERLALSRSTVYYWIRDIPIERKPPRTFSEAARQKGNRAMRAKYPGFASSPTTTVGTASTASLHMTRRSGTSYRCSSLRATSGTVTACLLRISDPRVVELVARWLGVLAQNKIIYSLQYHADQDPDLLRRCWRNRLQIEPSAIRLQRKSNSNQLRKRPWRSRFGVLTVCTNDTRLRAMMQGWVHEMERSWLHSAGIGV